MTITRYLVNLCFLPSTLPPPPPQFPPHHHTRTLLVTHNRSLAQQRSLSRPPPELFALRSVPEFVPARALSPVECSAASPSCRCSACPPARLPQGKSVTFGFMYLSFCVEERAGAGGGAGGKAGWKFGRLRFEFVWVEGYVTQATCAPLPVPPHSPPPSSSLPPPPYSFIAMTCDVCAPRFNDELQRVFAWIDDGAQPFPAKKKLARSPLQPPPRPPPARSVSLQKQFQKTITPRCISLRRAADARRRHGDMRAASAR